ncbi:MAG: alpha/beta hydrolase [Candidatus Eiseniibacteriota bacterium]
MKALAAAVVLALIALGVWLASPLPVRGLESRSRPSRDYAEALARVAELAGGDSPAIAPECRTFLLTHGHRTARVIVLFHGLTNCPAQFDSIARICFARGANVFVPRLPRHGFADHMTTQLALSDAHELRDFTDRALDAARGLGDSMTVAGLSVGGTLAAWAAVERPDVDRAVLIAPMLGVERAPGRWTPVVTRIAGALPNLFVWWDDRLKQNLGGPKHVYPRFASRSISATLRLGAVALQRARRSGASCRSVVMLTVGGDMAVDNGLCAEMVRSLRAHGAHEVETHQFPAEHHLNHDVVDPEQVGGNPAITYPVLLRMIGP